MEDKLNDSFYNTKPVIEKNRKLQDVPLNQEELDALKTKLNAWIVATKNWSNKL
jgi:hypothetical protein